MKRLGANRTMIDIEEQKLHFKNHIAKFTDYGNIKILDFKNPNSNEYRIRFLFEEDYYRLHITGDLGDLIASNYHNMCFDEFSDFLRDTGYFEGKIDCMSREIYYYDDDKAREDLLKLVEELKIEKWEFEDEEYTDLNEWISYVLESFSDINGIEEKGFEAFAKVIPDAFNEVSEIGKEKSGILELYMLAFELAMEQIKQEETENK